RGMPRSLSATRSMRSTVAPISASIIAAIGHSPIPANSITLIPVSGPIHGTLMPANSLRNAIIGAALTGSCIALHSVAANRAETTAVAMKLTIVIPCYNELKTIDAISDAFRQSQYPDKEIIVVDDCSSDGTREKLKAEIEPSGLVERV